MLINTLTNHQFSSNTYLIQSSNTCEDLVVIDAGAFSSDWSEPDAQRVCAVILTHHHYDHIQHLGDWLINCPSAKVMGSEYTITFLSDIKKNLSLFHGEPVMVEPLYTQLLEENLSLEIFSNVKLITLFTPGHNPGCTTYLIGNALFTGDSYIPFVPVVTKLKGGNRKEAADSLRKIRSRLKLGMTIYPGHGPAYPFSNLIAEDIDNQIARLESR